MGAAVWPGGVPSPALRRRAERAGRLFHAGRVDRIIVTGGIGDVPPAEADVAADVLHAMGISETAILRDTRSTTTFENLIEARRLLAQGETVIIVSDAFHLPRSVLTARRFGLAASGESTSLTGANPWRITRAALREIPALIWYAMRPLPGDFLT
ncbi:MAG: YdcF family protein [Pseudomonadota bacterium]|nr:YdcF family protein [Pseudomonadota bacterium]